MPAIVRMRLKSIAMTGTAFALLFAGWSFVAQGDSNRSTADQQDAGPKRSLDDAIKLGQESRAAYGKVQDYTAVFDKTEVVGSNLIEQSMDMKFRQKPFSVYLHCRSSKEKGREAIYVAGANSDKIVVHETGLKSLAGAMAFKLNDDLVMQENRYPITDLGIGRILEKSLVIWERDKKLSAEQVDVRIFDGQAASRPCDVVQIKYAGPQANQTYSLSRVYFDKETKLTIQAEQFGWPKTQGEQPKLLEKYTYTDVETNVGLTDEDFDTQNSKYGFGKGKISLLGK